MIHIVVTPAARIDLDDLWETDEDGAAEIEAVLEEISNDVDLMSGLCARGFRHLAAPALEVDRFLALWNQGLNMYRLKIWDWLGGLLPYRVIYAHHAQNDIFYILAVVPRDFNYDIQHPIITRVCSDYQRLGIPSYR